MVLYQEYRACHNGELIQKEFPIIQIFRKIGVGRVSEVINEYLNDGQGPAPEIHVDPQMRKSIRRLISVVVVHLREVS